ncbi:MAG: HAD family hydrolase [Sulfurimonas sp.]|uniref:HAD family hydrolase n=1 Tax=Sulfurimonas sp. TaxID=2022749 RepID=UPI00262B5F88|nr:HAD family hydrolase [Sulfurimonas sp.]MDD3475334.1 HAD family hydrolase [Sulfurimonas sp.]
MNLALFDFDGTLTTKDSLDEFLRYSVGKNRYLLNMLKFIPNFALWKLRFISNSKAKERLFEIFFKGMDEALFRAKAKSFSLYKLDSIINEQRMNILKEHQQSNTRVVIVSASMKCWLEPWCRKNDIELLSTELKFEDGKYSGKFLTPNCHGQEKTNRIKEYLNLDEYETIYAYGDSSGDMQMLAMAHFPTKY